MSENEELLIEKLNRFVELQEIKANVKREEERLKDALCAFVGVKRKGTITIEQSGFKLSTVGKISRSVKSDVWKTLRDEIPEALWPVRETLKLEPDTVKINALEAANPELWAKCAQAFVTKPGKPTLKVVKVED